jgi:hypothetical protein
MKQDKDFIINEPAEPVEFSEIMERNNTVNKPAISYKALAFVNRVMEQGNPLAIAENLSAIQYFIKEIEADDRLEEYVLEELNKSQGKVTLPSGTKIERIEAGTKYVFTNCNDSELNRLEWAAEVAAKAVKERKEFLKKVPASGLVVTNPETGETEHIYPPVKVSETTYKVTLNPKDPNPQPLSDDLPF